MKDKAFLFDLLKTPSPTGFERAGQLKWTSFLKPIADDVQLDVYGNAWATYQGEATYPTVMLEAHADEIGFMISYISDDGFIYVTRVGGTDHAIARGKRLIFQGDSGEVMGVIGNTAIHLRDAKNDSIPEWHELFVDIGASSKEAVAERGLRVGHVGVYQDTVDELSENILIGRALDNRMGGYIIAQAFKQLKALNCKANVVVVNAVQEEIGGHGAKMISYRLNPDVALVVDVTHATDSPGIEQKKHGKVLLNGGPSITHGTASHPNVVKRLMEVATKHDIPLQHEASSRWTGTDTDEIFSSRTGIPSALISLPMRYMHSTIELVDLRDVEKVIEMMTAFVMSIKPKDSFGWTI